MKWWFKRHPSILNEIQSRLSKDLNYKQLNQKLDNLFLSSGEIVVRYNGVHRFSILIVYPDSTPYQLPFIFMLKEAPSDALLTELSGLEFHEVANKISSLITIYYHRHQGSNGSLCILENDSIDGGIQIFDTESILKRVTNWCKSLISGEIEMDNSETELYAHFPFKEEKLKLLYTHEFLHTEEKQGEFCASIFRRLGHNDLNLYLSSLILQTTDAGVLADFFIKNQISTMPDGISTIEDYHTKESILKKAQEEGDLIRGLWFETTVEPYPFKTMKELVSIIGNGEIEEGYRRLFLLYQRFKHLPEQIFIGIRYKNRRNETEWSLFKVYKNPATSNPLLFVTLEEIPKFLESYETVSAINTEKFTDHNFHLRNSSRADRNILKDHSIQLIGCGALGGEIGDSLAKAGVGSIDLLDKEILHAHNIVRHVLGTESIGLPKVVALRHKLLSHNPFINVGYDHYNCEVLTGNVFDNSYDLSVSTIADDNIEGYVNEQALMNNQTVFYARALRGGKAARIFRVIPNKDACFNCLTLYSIDSDSGYIQIPEDLSLPTLRNECNNPIRPGSAADLKIISALTARKVLDYLQSEEESEVNHWIWSTEKDEAQGHSGSNEYKLTSYHYPIHPKCCFCNDKIITVKIQSGCIEKMLREIAMDSRIETGGIILGEIIGNEVIIGEVSDAGNNAIKTPTRFERDSLHCQSFLDGFEGKLIYVGEWHYHPSKDGKPSLTDIKSFKEIAEQKNYVTSNPISIIVTSDGKLHCTIHPYGKDYYNIAIEEI